MKKIKNALKNFYMHMYINKLKGYERRKFKDSRRKKIYNSVILSPEQKKEIDAVYEKNYGHKIPYTWHKHFTAYNEKFDKYYFPELLYIPEFEFFENLNKEYCIAFQDKNVLPIFAEKVNIKTPDVIVSCSCGVFHDSEYETITKDEAIKKLENVGECFAKPTINSSSGRGCMLLFVKNLIDTNSGKEISKIIDDIGDNFVIQKRIVCHKSIKKLYPESCNTFRIITYRWNGEIKYTPSIMRIGRGGKHLDNAHAGGMFIAIDDDGTLHEKAFTEFKEEFKIHPDTKVEFKGYKIHNFEKVLESAKKMHNAIPQIGVVNWDYTIGEDGEPILIEANLQGGSIWLSQMAHGVGAFGDVTPEILRWIKFMKKCSADERKKYMYGKMKKGDNE